MTPLDYDYVRKLLRERSGLVLSAEKEYLVESRLLPVARRAGLAGLAELVLELKRGPRAEPLAVEVVEAMATNETFFFRDRILSDLIGFQYMHAPAADSAKDLIGRLKELPDGSQVLIALDGENPWDYYPNNGREFLLRVFDGIRKDDALESVTLSEAMDRIPAEKLDWLAPGSWANANFSIWIGHPEDHEAWQWILRARQALMSGKAETAEKC